MRISLYQLKIQCLNFSPYYIESWRDTCFAMESTCPTDASCKVKNKYATGNNLLYPGANKMKPYNLVETGSFFSYFGGLTTLPCTQADSLSHSIIHPHRTKNRITRIIIDITTKPYCQ